MEALVALVILVIVSLAMASLFVYSKQNAKAVEVRNQIRSFSQTVSAALENETTCSSLIVSSSCLSSAEKTFGVSVEWAKLCGMGPTGGNLNVGDEISPGIELAEVKIITPAQSATSLNMVGTKKLYNAFMFLRFKPTQGLVGGDPRPITIPFLLAVDTTIGKITACGPPAQDANSCTQIGGLFNIATGHCDIASAMGGCLYGGGYTVSTTGACQSVNPTTNSCACPSSPNVFVPREMVDFQASKSSGFKTYSCVYCSAGGSVVTPASTGSIYDEDQVDAAITSFNNNVAAAGSTPTTTLATTPTTLSGGGGGGGGHAWHIGGSGSAGDAPACAGVSEGAPCSTAGQTCMQWISGGGMFPDMYLKYTCN
ncbi:MAG: hypothetical protein COT73_05930 [Bdellovibrio sp. CG10_big_fil_rev_8_21_14_0_10_47_8]|nr:MAG: hypothetical protein COT73_05930 [Bdellovibrio sp. CG10_big_fil_rev_8_21_14_0_10_47_8]